MLQSHTNKKANNKPFRTTQAFVAIFPVLLGLVFFVIITNNFLITKETKFDEIALGSETKSHYSTFDNSPTHCRGVSDATTCIDGWEKRGKHSSLLWLGNSQLHAINQMKENDDTGASLLFRILQPSGLDLLTFSQPNANFQEHYVLFEYLANQLKPKTLILAAVFDDTRDTGLRNDISLALLEPDVIKSLNLSPIGKALIKEFQPEKNTRDFAGLHETIQEIVESRLTAWLTQHSPMWAARPELRGQLLHSLYLLRNLALGINPQSKRRIIKGRYDKNLSAFSAILNSAKKKNIQTLVYIAPLRDDVEVPYVSEEYELFKNAIQQYSKESDATFINLEHLVPGELWGSKDATTMGGDRELDFMHFQGDGHKLLAAQIYELLKQHDMVKK